MDQMVKVSQCLNGDRERDCSWCDCHHSRNGKCCFGIRHEYNHPDCDACVLHQDCAALTHGYRAQTQRGPVATYAPPRPVYTNTPPQQPSGHQVRVATGTRAPTMANYGPQPGEPLLVPQPIRPKPLELNPDDNLFTRFWKVTSWGAGEGFFEMAVNFFRIRRPE